ncbi:MAG: glycosyl hydrolase, partial [Saprospiraceae bacterium]|nr:glycosyl hydrolase [Saprospiraceae bacterium]
MKKRSILLFLTVIPFLVFSQKSKKDNSDSQPIDDVKLSGLTFRSVGPAFTSGRISDFAVDPDNPQVYYVATASGGVWKTINSGTTYKPIFDNEGSYSIGCVAMAPTNSNLIWVGTGENNNQRSVAYGDGVYKSLDGGQSWKNMGLENSEHIGKIIIHPDDENVVYVAAIGPLWNKGGDRGVYKTTDGGETWELVLEIDEHTGVTDLVMDPRDPDVMYAAAFQRARHVFTYLGGGPGSGIHKTTDGGETWVEVNKGLPGGDLGRIGLAISPANPEVIYAIVEATGKKSGFYRSTNRGASWEKRGNYVTSGNYYQEIVADPKDENVVYGMDTWMKVSEDGGKSFQNVGEKTKHVDNHCMWIDPENTSHWLVGCDGGIYETWDAAATWDFKSNLPVTQFYKVAVDNAEPFYHIYGGTQDNFSIGGPSRTNTSHGIRNSDWFITHGGDGFESQVDPKNPNIVYSQSQYGVLVRYDKKSGEEVGIQPKPRKDEDAYRWNWDAPLAVSHHVDGRLYFAANKVFRSDDRGNSWEVISDDLTREIDRNQLEIMDRVWSLDAVAKNRSTSPYGTIVAFSESPLNKDLLVAGTDDGLIQITEDGGENWTEIDEIEGVPERTYVNAVFCSQHDENVIYAAFNHHKYGDFSPYIYMSSDKGKSWKSISSNLPERGSVYGIEEDHVDGDLIFCGTEFGVFFSPNKGRRWKQLKSGVPTIAVRDLSIQKRENDLVLGTFGRGFYVLDDYSCLREIEGEPESDKVYAVRSPLLFEKNQPLGLPGKSFQGDSYYTGENLGPEAIFTYYLKEDLETKEKERQKKEAEEQKEGKDNKYP